MDLSYSLPKWKMGAFYSDGLVWAVINYVSNLGILIATIMVWIGGKKRWKVFVTKYEK